MKRKIRKILVILLIISFIMILPSCKNALKVEEEFPSETTVIETANALETEETTQITVVETVDESKTENDVIKLNPSLLGNYSTDIVSGNGDIFRANHRGIELLGNRMFLGYYVYDKKTDKNYYGFKVLDITNQANIKEIGDYVQINKFWELVDGISEDYIYITNGSDGFQIIDINRIPTIVGIYKTSAIHGVVKEDIAYVADANGLQVIDISDKKNPNVVGDCKIDIGTSNRIYINGNYAYMQYLNLVNEETEYGFQIIDISNLENPINLGKIAVFAMPIDVFINDNYIYLLEVKFEEDNRYSRLQIIDITDKNNPYIIGELDLNRLSSGYAYDFYKTGDKIFVAYGEGGILIIDTKNNEKPELIGNFKTDGWALYVYEGDNKAYLTDTNKGLIILDTKDIKDPKIIGICDTPGYEPFFIINNNFAYVEYVNKDFEKNYTEEKGVQIFKLQ